MGGSGAGTSVAGGVSAFASMVAIVLAGFSDSDSRKLLELLTLATLTVAVSLFYYCTVLRSSVVSSQ